MVNLTRIYTRTGDDGTTALVDMSRVRKTDPRLEAYADTDETNCALGMVVANHAEHVGPEVAATLRRIQNELFDLGADLGNPLAETYPYPPLRITQDYVDALEADCDRYNADVEPLRSFVLPGGSPAAAQLHVARAVSRRAERRAWAAVEAYGTGAGGVNPLAVTYLNRLSDLLFILCRRANAAVGDVLWVPGGPDRVKP